MSEHKILASDRGKDPVVRRMRGWKFGALCLVVCWSPNARRHSRAANWSCWSDSDRATDSQREKNMDRKRSGRKRPEELMEPRELLPYTAAHDQAEVIPEPVFLKDTSTGFDGQIAGDSPGVQPETGVGSDGDDRNVLMDTGWYAHGEWEVRVVVLGGPPSTYRRRWFQGMLMRD